MSNDISVFYNEHADLYQLISNDRDFDQQINCLSEGVDLANGSLLELFAGPAFHSVAARRSGWSRTVCIDSSEKMRHIALKSGLPENSYIVDVLPSGLENISGGFDLVLLLRYSIGYLEHSQLLILLENIKNVLCIGGKVALELHDIQGITNGYKSLDIRERTVDLPDNGGFFSCVWPDGEVEWDSDDWVAHMPVTLTWDRPNNNTYSEELVSSERIYSKNDIFRLFEQVGGFRPIELGDSKNVFKGSVIVGMEKC